MKTTRLLWVRAHARTSRPRLLLSRSQQLAPATHVNSGAAGLRPSSPLPLREESHARRAPLINSSHPHNPVVNPTLATCRCHSHLSYLLYARTLGHADYSQKFEKLTSSCVFLRLTLLTLVLSGEG